jgi:hypothetical protein
MRFFSQIHLSRSNNQNYTAEQRSTRVRVLADEGLIQEYFRLHKTNNLDMDSQDKNTDGRIKVISNPRRKISKVPFGMIIIDGKEIGIEFVDQYNPRKYTADIC